MQEFLLDQVKEMYRLGIIMEACTGNSKELVLYSQEAKDDFVIINNFLEIINELTQKGTSHLCTPKWWRGGYNLPCCSHFAGILEYDYSSLCSKVFQNEIHI